MRGKKEGCLYKPKGSRFWWIAYHSNGKRHFEGTKTELKGEAIKILNDRTNRINKGIAVTAEMGRITIKDGLQAVIDDLEMNGKKSVEHTKKRMDKHLLAFWPKEVRMSTISAGDIEKYKAHRIREKAKPATVNRELAALRRAYKLAMKHDKLAAMPYVSLLSEKGNARKGFIESSELERICEHLPAEYHPPLKFAFETGWRFFSETLKITADRVDLDRGTVGLEAGTTKSGEARTFAFTAELRRILTEQMEDIKQLKEKGVITPWVFHHADGSALRNFRKMWNAAREKAGLKHRLLHDFRRTAVRNLARAGVDRGTAMKLVGHQTESMYERYNIQDDVTLQEGAAKLDAWREAQKVKPKEAPRGQVKQFRKKRAG